MADKLNKIKEIVFETIKNIGEEDGVKSFKIPTLDTKISANIDSMGIVALSVDLEERYQQIFDNEIKILNDEKPDFMENYETIETLINYINTL